MATVTIQKYIGKNKKSYVVRYKDPVTRKSRYYKTFQKKREAQQSANDLRSILDSGKMEKVKERKLKREGLTFATATDSLVQWWSEKLGRKELRPETFYGYEYRANALKRIFGKRLICEITTEDIVQYHNKCMHDLSAVSANRYLFNIKQVFKHAIMLGAIVTDASDAIKYFNEDDHKRNNFIGPAIIDELVAHSRTTRGKFYMPALIYLGAEHGTAKQEALSLNWEDIDFEFENIGMIRFFRYKNRIERTEYLMPRSKGALLEWRQHLDWMRRRKKIAPVRTDRVFCRLDGTPIGRFDKAWRRARDLAHLNDFHYHDLRHTFCSNLLLSGSDLKDVKEMIGHSDLSMTDRYAHLTIKHKLSRQQCLARYYAGGKDKWCKK